MSAEDAAQPAPEKENTRSPSKPPVPQRKIHDLSGFTQGAMFICTSKTWQECVFENLFGAPRKYWESVVNRIDDHTALFCYNIWKKCLYGVYKCKGGPELDINPAAWGGGFPSQVRTQPVFSFPPIKIGEFPKSVRDRWEKIQILNKEETDELLRVYISKCHQKDLQVDMTQMIIQAPLSQNSGMGAATPDMEAYKDDARAAERSAAAVRRALRKNRERSYEAAASPPSPISSFPGFGAAPYPGQQTYIGQDSYGAMPPSPVFQPLRYEQPPGPYGPRPSHGLPAAHGYPPSPQMHSQAPRSLLHYNPRPRMPQAPAAPRYNPAPAAGITNQQLYQQMVQTRQINAMIHHHPHPQATHQSPRQHNSPMMPLPRGYPGFSPHGIPAADPRSMPAVQTPAVQTRGAPQYRRGGTGGRGGFKGYGHGNRAEPWSVGSAGAVGQIWTAHGHGNAPTPGRPPSGRPRPPKENRKQPPRRPKGFSGDRTDEAQFPSLQGLQEDLQKVIAANPCPGDMTGLQPGARPKAANAMSPVSSDSMSPVPNNMPTHALQRKPAPGATLLVEDVPNQVSDSVLRKGQLFGKFGTPTVERREVPGKENKNVFITYDSVAQANQAVKHLNGKKVRFRKNKNKKKNSAHGYLVNHDCMFKLHISRVSEIPAANPQPAGGAQDILARLEATPAGKALGNDVRNGMNIELKDLLATLRGLTTAAKISDNDPALATLRNKRGPALTSYLQNCPPEEAKEILRRPKRVDNNDDGVVFEGKDKARRTGFDESGYETPPPGQLLPSNLLDTPSDRSGPSTDRDSKGDNKEPSRQWQMVEQATPPLARPPGQSVPPPGFAVQPQA